MKNLLVLLLALFFCFPLFGQTEEIEIWRQQGYQARLDRDYTSAITFYEKILEYSPEDYDARLAIGRLYLLTEQYQNSIDIFSEIFSEDSTDVEAMNGLGASYGSMGKDRLSIYYFEKSLTYYQDDINQYFNLAKAYGNGGKIDQALEIYREAMAIDSTYSEVWAGMGKMYYWKGKPSTAVRFYGKALELDPENEEIRKENDAAASELNYGLSVSFGPVNEQEENYDINAMISKIGFEKRINDNFQVQAGFLLDYSNRTYSDDEGDTTRWYDNTWAKGSWITRHHKLSVFGGFSSTDNKFSSYGLNWKLNYSPGKISIQNALNAGYDYFYYWNKVGSNALAEEFTLTYSRLGFEARYSAGLVDAVTVIDYSADGESFIDQNPYQAYGLSVTCTILRKPVIKLGINHSYLDYKYKSPLYYSPFNRFLTGASVSVYQHFSRFYCYGSFAYNVGTEKNYEDNDNGKMKEVELNVNNWSTNIELGYDFYPFSFSIGGSNFYNPYYQNLTGFATLKILF